MNNEEKIASDLAACHRLIDHFDMGDTIYTHISARLDEPSGAFMMTPFGLLFDEIEAEDLLLLDAKGRLLQRSRHTVNAAGFVIHSAIYGSRPEIKCVIHTHSVAGVAVSAFKAGLLPISQSAMEFYNRISYHDYEGLAIDFNECERIVRDMKSNSAMIMRNHGLLVAGTSIPAAFETMYYLEQACRIQLKACAMGECLVMPPPEICEQTAAQFAIEGMLPKGARLWPAMLRKLQRLAPQ